MWGVGRGGWGVGMGWWMGWVGYLGETDGVRRYGRDGMG